MTFIPRVKISLKIVQDWRSRSSTNFLKLRSLKHEHRHTNTLLQLSIINDVYFIHTAFPAAVSHLQLSYDLRLQLSIVQTSLHLSLSLTLTLPLVLGLFSVIMSPSNFTPGRPWTAIGIQHCCFVSFFALSIKPC